MAVANAYPRAGDPRFSEKLFRFEEFAEVATGNTAEQKILGLRRHQNLVQRLISPATGYDKLLLVHSTGSGKTWTMASVIDTFKRFYRKKALVIVQGETAEYAFKTNTREWYGKYYSGSESTIEAYVSRYVEFDRYIKLSKDLRGMTDAQVEEKFSDRVIVIDEAHKLNTKELDSGKAIYVQISRALGLAKNSKVIVATATPVVDVYHEVFSLINLVLPVELRLESDESQTLDNLRKVAYGRVSQFSRGRSEKPLIINVGTVVERYRQSFIFLEMRGRQKEAYGFLPWNSNDMYMGKRYASLCVLPREFEDDVPIFKKSNIPSNYFEKDLCVFSNEKVVSGIREMFDSGKLYEYSCKLAYFLDEIMKPERANEKCFIFCRQVQAFGVKSVAAVLQAIGFKMYEGKEDVSSLEKEPRFIVLTGESIVTGKGSSFHAQKIDAFNHPDNAYGEYVKILLVSDVGSESLSLKCVRQVHLFTPFWNNNKAQQVIARSVRMRSHAEFADPSERYVRVYRYIAVYEPSDELKAHSVRDASSENFGAVADLNFPEDVEKSIDLREQTKANEKTMMSVKVYNILRKASVDFRMWNPVDAGRELIRSEFGKFYYSLPVEPVLNYVTSVLGAGKSLDVYGLCEKENVSVRTFDRVLKELRRGFYTIAVNGRSHAMTVSSGIVYLQDVLGKSECLLSPDVKLRSGPKDTFFRISNASETETFLRNLEKTENGSQAVAVLSEAIKNPKVDMMRAVEISLSRGTERCREVFKSAWIRDGDAIYHMVPAVLLESNNYNRSASMNPRRLFDKVRVSRGGGEWVDYVDNADRVLSELADNYNRVREEKAREGRRVFAYYSVTDSSFRIRNLLADSEANKRLKKRGRVLQNYNNEKELKYVTITMVTRELSLAQLVDLAESVEPLRNVALVKSDNKISGNVAEFERKYPVHAYVVYKVLSCGRVDLIRLFETVCFRYDLFSIVV
jgi:hypothetical protein